MHALFLAAECDACSFVYFVPEVPFNARNLPTLPSAQGWKLGIDCILFVLKVFLQYVESSIWLFHFFNMYEALSKCN